ncbi:MAG TPA: efflux RND transporter permease subunit, partial [Gemmatimonadales bacterium]|nr:efflux RND transporter permease subunit [Gemmatimonadales bacterium]
MIRWAVDRPAVIAATALALCLAGGVAFTRLPLATRTTVEMPRISVTVSWPGVAAEVVETYLTSPIEAAVQAVRGVRKTSSESSEGQARLTIELEPAADVRMARLAILERMELLRPEFPLGARAPQVANWVPEDLNERPLIRYTITGPYTAGALSRIADDDIVPRLSAVPGVAGITTQGGAELGVSVAYDPSFLRRQGVSPALLFDALNNSRIVTSLGNERLGASTRTVVLRDQPNAIEDLADLPIAGPGGRVFRLGDLATVRPEEDAGGRFYRINGLPAVSLDVSRLAAADAIQTAARVRALVAELAPVLPPGVRLRVEDDESIELARQLTDLVRRGVLAAVSVALVLILTLRNFRATALVLGSAAVAIAGTALGLYLLEIPANLLTLAGLGMGIGVLVQNGLVVMERLRTAPDTAEGRAAAGRNIMPAVVGSTLTTGVVLLPFLYLQGNARAAFVPFAAAFALALGSSVLSSLVMVPALGAGHGVARGGWPRLDRAYRWMLIKLLRWRWVTVAVTLAALGVLTWGFVHKVPRYNWGDWFGQRTTLSASLGFPRGSDPVSLDQGMREFEKIVVGVPGVEQVVTTAFGDRAYMRVVFEKEAGLGPLPSQMQEALTQRAVLIGGASVSVQGSGPGFNSGFGGGGSVSYRIKLLGYSFDGVERLALDLKERLERIPRVREVNINAGSWWGQEKAFTVTLVPDRAALARYGLTARDLAAAVAREVRGPVGAQRLDIGGEQIEVNLKAAGARDRTLEQLRAALVPTRSGAPVRVGDLATVEEREGLGTVSREDQQYVRIGGYDFRGPNKLADRTHNAFMASIAVPPGYSAADQRFDYDRDESGKGLWLVFGIGVALVVLAVALVFDSVWATLMVSLSLPIAVAGVAAAFWVAGAAFGRVAAVGVILVVGLAVNQALLLVHGALEKRSGGEAGKRERLTGADVV